MPNVINNLIVRELTEAFSSAEGMVIVSLDGLTVHETEGLRNSLAEHGVRLRMVRNRLARIAVKDAGVEVGEDVFAGGSVAFASGSPEEAIHAAKVLDGSPAKKEGKIAFRGGLLDGESLGADEAAALAGLPGKDELRAMILGCLSGPARGLVMVLNGLPGGLARIVQARIDEGGFAGDASAPAEEAPVAEAPAEEAPAEEPAADESPEGDAPSEETTAGEA